MFGSNFYESDVTYVPRLGTSLYYVSKRSGGGWLILLTFSTVFMLIRWVGGVQKGKKNADVI